MATSFIGTPNPPTENEIEEDIAQWERGRALRGIVTSTEWEILLDTLRSYVDGAETDLFRLPPGDPAVPTAHAAWSATKQLVHQFKEDVEAAVHASYRTPESIKKLAALSPNQ